MLFNKVNHLSGLMQTIEEERDGGEEALLVDGV